LLFMCRGHAAQCSSEVDTEYVRTYYVRS
jgi:hypothetical protein